MMLVDVFRFNNFGNMQLRGDLIEVFKMFMGCEGVDYKNYFILSRSVEVIRTNCTNPMLN